MNLFSFDLDGKPIRARMVDYLEANMHTKSTIIEKRYSFWFIPYWLTVRAFPVNISLKEAIAIYKAEQEM